MKTGKENDNTEQEYRPRGVLLGPIPYTLDRVSDPESNRFGIGHLDHDVGKIPQDMSTEDVLRIKRTNDLYPWALEAHK